jgi:hypothetical protein
MNNTYLTMAAVLALSTAAALTQMTISQQVFAQDGAESETETENQAENKCNNSGFSTCDQTASTRFCATSGGIDLSRPLSPSIIPASAVVELCPPLPPPDD